MDLTMETLQRPYEQGDFIAQLIAAGVSCSSIDQMLARGNGAQLLRWLHGDIDQNEARILNGERHTRVVGVASPIAGRCWWSAILSSVQGAFLPSADRFASMRSPKQRPCGKFRRRRPWSWKRSSWCC